MALGISLQSVAKAFDGRTVLRDVSLQIPASRSTVLIGPSACGKTLLVRCILGLVTPDSGEIRFSDTGGRTVDRIPVDDIGVLFQQNALFDSMTIWENVAFRQLNTGQMSRTTARDHAIQQLQAVGLSAATADLLPFELSGGMQKRAGLARALSTDPRLLVLDDPTAGLDPILTATILDLVQQRTAEASVTVLAITGDMKVAQRGFDRIAMLYDGTIRWFGAGSDIDACDDPYLLQMINGRASGPIPVGAIQAGAMT